MALGEVQMEVERKDKRTEVVGCVMGKPYVKGRVPEDITYPMH